MDVDPSPEEVLKNFYARPRVSECPLKLWRGCKGRRDSFKVLKGEGLEGSPEEGLGEWGQPQGSFWRGVEVPII